MATRQQIERGIVPRLIAKGRDELDFAQVLAAITAANPGSQQQIVSAVRRNDARRLLQAVASLVDDTLKEEASVQASAILADSAMSLDELDTVFGPF